jgi:hypothetical protein
VVIVVEINLLLLTIFIIPPLPERQEAAHHTVSEG